MSILRGRWPLLATIGIFVIHGAIVFTLGVLVPPDSLTFSRWADSLLASHFNYAAVVTGASARNLPAGMYMLFTTMVAIAKLVAGAKWPAVLVTANLICDALTGAILVQLVLLTTRSIAAALAAFTAWLVCFEIVTWVRMPLTDVAFLFLSFAAFASLAAQRLRGEPLNRKSLSVTAMLVVLAIFLRPVGFLWLILIASAYVVLAGRVSRRVIVFGSLLFAGFVFAGHTFLVQDPQRWPLEMLSRSVRWDARSYQRGEVVLQRLETYHRPPSALADYAAITADRFVHFFAVIGRSFSRTHMIASSLFYVPLYLLAIWTLVRSVREQGVVADIAVLSAGFILVVAFWHALVVIDFDWRYRLPVLPHLIFLASCALPRSRLIERRCATP